MAYGKNPTRKHWQMRAFPLAVGEISGVRRAKLLDLRRRVLDLMRQMAVAGFSPDPLIKDRQGKALDAVLLNVQKDCEGLNSVWREQARMRVKPALEESSRRYLRRLAGRLRFVDQEIPEIERKEVDGLTRRYFHIPPEVQDGITPAEIASLKAIGESGNAIATFRRIIVEGDTSGFSDNHLRILRDIHARCLALHRVPDFGAADDFTLQLHLDARMLPQGGNEALDLRTGAGRILADDANALYYRFLDIAGVAPRDDRLRLPLAITRKIAQRLDRTAEHWASLILELSKRAIGVRLVAGQPQEALPDHATTFVGRDFGYVNTVSLSVAVSDEAVDLEAVKAELARIGDQGGVRAHLTSRGITDDIRIVERLRFDGRPFIARANALCEKIDAFKSRIDTAYNGLAALKQAIAADLGLAPEERITPDMKARHPQVRAFFATLGLIDDLKKVRRSLYRKIASLKKAWFGFLSNIEVSLAQKHKAAIVREDLTVAAIEKDSPTYKGRTFNKMLNHGSKGQYQKRATDKLRWNGVPELVVPSWYTSRACLRHAQIADKKHRKGEQIFLPCCNAHDHADEHAADTIACYPFLRPKLTPAGEILPGFVTPALPPAHSFTPAVGSSGL